MPMNVPQQRAAAPSAPHDAITQFAVGVIVVSVGSFVVWAFLRERQAAVATGIAAAAVFSLVRWVFRARPAGHPARHAASASVALVALDALVVGGIALAGWPDTVVTWGRVALLATHVTLTLALLGTLAMTVWHLAGAPAARWRGQGADGAIVLSMLLLTLGQAISGVLAALGTRVAPITLLPDAVQAALPPAAHFLQRLHGAHPLIAILTAAAVIRGALLLARRRGSPATKRYAGIASLMVMAQLAIGALNSAYFAPTALRIPHLVAADGLWIAIVALGAAALVGGPKTEDGNAK